MRATIISTIALGLVLFGILGCTKTQSHDEGTLKPWPDRAVGSVAIYMPDDTISLGEGDSTVADGWVLVSDEQGRVLPGAPVSLSLEVSDVGTLISPDPAQGNSDDSGRVNFRYRSYNRTGSNAILVDADHHTARRPFVVVPWQVNWHLTMTAVPDPLHSMITSEDSMLIVATLKDAGDAAVPNIQITLQNSGGRFTAPFPRTNALGQAQGYWQAWNQVGRFTIVGHVGTATTSVEVQAIPPIGSARLLMATDTLAYLSGDSAFVNGSIVVRDRQDRPMSGVKVNFRLLDPIGFLQFPDPLLLDTTNSAGSVAVRFGVYQQIGHQTIQAHAASTVAQWNLEVIEQHLSGTVTIVISPDTIRTGHVMNDSVRVDAFLVDESRNGISGISLNFHAQGRLSTFPPTDLTGRTLGTWWPDGLGRFSIAAGTGALADTAYVVVIDTTH